MLRNMTLIIHTALRPRALERFGLVLALAFAADAAGAETLPRGRSVAQLATPLEQPREVIIDGRFWHCADQACSAAAQDGADSQPLWMECSHVAQTFGAIVSYQTGDDVLAPAKLERCNSHAKAPSRS